MANITSITYPCYLQPIFGDIAIYTKATPIKGFGELNGYREISLLGYIYKGIYYIFDYKDSGIKTSQSYSERVVRVRQIVNQLNNYSKYRELTTITIRNPREVIDFERYYIKLGYEGIKLINMYDFGYVVEKEVFFNV